MGSTDTRARDGGHGKAQSLPSRESVRKWERRSGTGCHHMLPVRQRATGEDATRGSAVQDEPHISVSPEAAVLRQLEALRQRDIATVYAFASPANRRNSGPLGNFAALLDTPIYRPLVGHLDSEVLRPRMRASSAPVDSANAAAGRARRRCGTPATACRWCLGVRERRPEQTVGRPVLRL